MGKRRTNIWHVTVYLESDDGERATQEITVKSDGEPPTFLIEFVINGRVYRPVYQMARRSGHQSSRRRR